MITTEAVIFLSAACGGGAVALLGLLYWAVLSMAHRADRLTGDE